jgi:hypothetical protein
VVDLLELAEPLPKRSHARLLFRDFALEPQFLHAKRLQVVDIDLARGMR